jgi:hypothetical protein
MKLRTCVSMVIAVGWMMGCHSYAPSSLDRVGPKSKVRLLLSTEGEIDLENRLGVRTRELTGEIVEMDDQQILIDVPMAEKHPDFGEGSLNQRLDIPRDHVLEVSARESDPARTGLLVAVSAGGVAALVTFGVSSSNTGDFPEAPPGPDERRVSWIYRLPTGIRH